MADEAEGSPSVPFIGKSSFRYNSPHAGDLSFPQNATIHVIREEDEDWYFGDYEGKQGIFPKNFVLFIAPLETERENGTENEIGMSNVPPTVLATSDQEEPEDEYQHDEVENELDDGDSREIMENDAESLQDQGTIETTIPEENHQIEKQRAMEAIQVTASPLVPLPVPPVSLPVSSSAPVPPRAPPQPAKAPSPPPTLEGNKLASPSRPAIPTSLRHPNALDSVGSSPSPSLETLKPSESETVTDPSTRSFRDRLAAFNKAASAPPVPKPLPKPQNIVRRPFMDIAPAQPSTPSGAPVVPPSPSKLPPKPDKPIVPVPEASSISPAKQEYEADATRPAIGSLRDRISALQSMNLPVPGVPGRPPPLPPKRRPPVPMNDLSPEHETEAIQSPSPEDHPVITEDTKTSLDFEAETTTEVPEVVADVEENNQEEPDEDSEVDEEEQELKRRQAIAARMAALGGARIGLAPLPRRAPPPRRKANPPPPPPEDEVPEEHESKNASESAPEEDMGTPTSDMVDEEEVEPIAINNDDFVDEETDMPPPIPSRLPPTSNRNDADTPTSLGVDEDSPPPLPISRASSMVSPPRRPDIPTPLRSQTSPLHSISSPLPEDDQDENDEDDVPPPIPAGRPFGGRPPIPPSIAQNRPSNKRTSLHAEVIVVPPQQKFPVEDPEDDEVSTLPLTSPSLSRPPVPHLRSVPPPPYSPVTQDYGDEGSETLNMDDAEDKVIPNTPSSRMSEPDRVIINPAMPSSVPPKIPKAPLPPVPSEPTSMIVSGVSPPSAPLKETSPPAGINPPMYLAQDIDLDRSSGWWLTDPIQLPSSLRGRQDLTFQLDGSSKMKKGKWIVNLNLHILFADLSQTIISVAYAQGDTSSSSATLSQRHNPPPSPRPTQSDLQKWSSTLGSGILGYAFQQTSRTVGDGSSFALVNAAIRTIPRALKPIGNMGFGYLIYEAHDARSSIVEEENEIRPGDLVVLLKAKFHGRHGLASYNQFAGFDSRGPQVSIVTEFDKSKRKIRVLEQGDSTDESGSVGRNPIVESNSYKVTNLKSGIVRVYRLMESSAIPEWIDEED